MDSKNIVSGMGLEQYKLQNRLLFLVNNGRNIGRDIIMIIDSYEKDGENIVEFASALNPNEVIKININEAKYGNDSDKNNIKFNIGSLFYKMNKNDKIFIGPTRYCGNIEERFFNIVDYINYINEQGIDENNIALLNSAHALFNIETEIQPIIDKGKEELSAKVKRMKIMSLGNFEEKQFTHNLLRTISDVVTCISGIFAINNKSKSQKKCLIN